MFIRLICALLLVILICPRSEGQDSHPKLKDLLEMDIAVKSLNTSATDIELTTESLNSQSLVALRRGNSDLKISKSARSYIYIAVDLIVLGTGCVASVAFQLSRPVNVIGDSGPVNGVDVSVWNKGALLTGPCDGFASRIRETVSEKISTLAAGYYRDNPN